MEKLKLDDFLNYHFISGLNSIEKDRVFMIIAKASEDKNSYYKNLYLYDKELKQLTYSNDLVDYCIVDDKEVLLIKKDKEEMIFSYLNYHNGILRDGFKLKLFDAKIKIIDKNRIAILSTIKKDNQEKDNTKYEILDETPFYFNGAGFINGNRTALFIMDINKPNTLKRLTNNYTNVSKIEIKDNIIYYLAEEYKTKPNNYPSIYKYDGETSLVYGSNNIHIRDFYLGDDCIYILGSDEKTWGINQNSTIYKYDGSLNVLYDNQEALDNSVGSDCRLGKVRSVQSRGNNLFYVSTRFNGSYLFKNNGIEIKLPLNNEGSIDDFVVVDSKVYYVGLIGNQLQELYSYDLISLENKQLTLINQDVLNDKYIADYEDVKFVCHDYEINGFVLKPKDYNPNKKYPAILDVHGGPKTVYGKVFYHEMQYWANEGYFVMFANPIGSDGRGNDFMHMSGKYGTKDFDCLMKFVDVVTLKYPQIDKDNIFETGGSYGGFMTNWIIGHTNRFKACASQRSISNWTSFAGTSDIGYMFVKDQILGLDLDKDQDKLWDRSPLKYAKNCTTPTLFIHSDEDYRCPMEQGLQMMSALIENGVETRMCYFHHENHELSRGGKPLNRIKRLEEITNWFNKHKGVKNV